MNAEIIKLTFGVIIFAISLIVFAIKITVKAAAVLIGFVMRILKSTSPRKKNLKYRETYRNIKKERTVQQANLSSCDYPSSADIGRQGEEDLLNVLNKRIGDNLTLSNLYIPKRSGDYTEADAVHITPHGIFLIEYKNYNADIYVSDNGEWSRAKKGTDKKYSFYSPVKQNLSHKYAVASYLKEHYTGLKGIERYINPYVVFGDGADISDVPGNISGCEIANLKDLDDSIFYSSMLSKYYIGADTRLFLFGELSKLKYISDDEKQQHIKRILDIKSRYGCA